MGAANVLGNVAGGVHQAYEADMQRQFADELDRRRQLGDFLDKIATDESARPESRQAAVSERVRMFQTPFHKPYKFDPNVLIAPRTAPQTNASFTPGAAPGTVQPPIPGPTPPPVSAIGGMPSPPGITGAAPTPPPDLVPQQGSSSVAQVTPGQAPGIFKTPDVLAREAAAKTGAVAGAQMGGGQYVRNPDGSLSFQPISGAGAPIGPGVQNAVSPYTLRPHLEKAVGTDAAGRPTAADFDRLTGQYLDPSGQPIPGFVPFQPSLVGHTTGEHMGQGGDVTKTTTPVPTPPPGASAAPATGAAAGKGGAKTVQPKPANTTAASTTHIQTFDPNDPNPIAQDGIAWATQGVKPVGGAMAERQVRTWMAQHGLKAALPVPPALQRQIQELFVARNSAIDLTSDVLKNSDVLDSLISTGKIQMAISPDKGPEVLSRMTDMSPKELKVASDFQQLIEHANLMRGPLGATGFRGEEAWQALQAQRGNLMGRPEITRNVLSGLRDRLIKLNSADAMVLSGHGMDTSGAGGVGPTPPPGGAPSAGSPSPETHMFDLAAWKTANPKGNADAAKAEAKRQGYTVKE